MKIKLLRLVYRAVKLSFLVIIQRAFHNFASTRLTTCRHERPLVSASIKRVPCCVEAVVARNYYLMTYSALGTCLSPQDKIRRHDFFVHSYCIIIIVVFPMFVFSVKGIWNSIVYSREDEERMNRNNFIPS